MFQGPIPFISPRGPYLSGSPARGCSGLGGWAFQSRYGRERQDTVNICTALRIAGQLAKPIHIVPSLLLTLLSDIGDLPPPKTGFRYLKELNPFHMRYSYRIEATYTMTACPDLGSVCPFLTIPVLCRIGHRTDEGNSNKTDVELLLGLPYDDDAFSGDEVVTAIVDHQFSGLLT